MIGLKLDMNLFNFKKMVMGLDIGFSSIKLAIFSHVGKTLVLEKVAIKEIKLEDKAHLRNKLMLEAVKELFKDINVKKYDFNICINSDQVITKIVTTPVIPEEELSASLRLNIQQYFNMPADNVYFDFDVLNEIVVDNIKQLRIALIVISKQSIADTLKLLKRVGVQPTSVIPAGNALKKILDSSSLNVDPLCLVDLSAQHTEFAIIKEKTLAFFRKIPISSQDFTKAMTQPLSTERGSVQLSFEEAEQFKREVGIPESFDEELILGKITTHELMSMLRVPLENLTEQIHRCLGYYREEHNQKIDTLYLFGRGSMLKGLKNYISSELDIEAEVIENLKKLNIESKIDLPEFGVVSYARALGAGMSLGEGINFLPPEIRYKTQRMLKRLFLGIGVSLICLFVLICFMQFKNKSIQLGKQIQIENKKFNNLKRIYDSSKGHMQADYLAASEPYWEDVFKELSHLLPRHTQLTSWVYEAGQPMLIKANVKLEGSQSIEPLLKQLNSGLFKNTKITRRVFSGDEVLEAVGLSFEME
ncbi:MAG: type IV pilus assembly protein PilM [Candidatus Omnitrophota bacterium]